MWLNVILNFSCYIMAHNLEGISIVLFVSCIWTLKDWYPWSFSVNLKKRTKQLVGRTEGSILFHRSMHGNDEYDHRDYHKPAGQA